MGSQENLKAIRLFTGFDDADIEAFVEAGARRSVPEGHRFFGMGDPNDSLFVIIAGAVRVDRHGTSEDIPLATLGAGQTFGEMSFMDDSRTTAGVTATESTEFLEVPRAALDGLLEARPDMGAKLWRNFALDLKSRLARTNELVEHYMDINQVLIEEPALRAFYSRP